MGHLTTVSPIHNAVMAEKSHITYKGIPTRLTVDLSAETLPARREWQDIFKVMKGKNL